MACKPMSTVVLPRPILIWTLINKLIWKLVPDYASIYVKFINCHQRVTFLRVCLENDIIPKFLPEITGKWGVFGPSGTQFSDKTSKNGDKQGKDR